MTAGADEQDLPLSFPDVFKRVVLGKPLITEELAAENLSNPVALGALSPDAISSTAYGPEQILTELLPHAGLAAFVLLLPIMGVILLILVLVAASYRQVVMTYTRAGGSYIVARENFGPRVAQVAAAALLIDYVVTVAVQSAAGTVAVASALPALGPYSLEITVTVVILIIYLNLRGLREAGLPFAIATYAFVLMVAAMIVTGVIRHIFWGLPQYDPGHVAGAVPVHQGSGLVMGATILVLLRAFANGGSSLTGVEAISNTVQVFRKPQSINARRVLTAMACILGFLLAGVGYLTYATHAAPYLDEYPSVLSQVARTVFGNGVIGNSMYVLVQISTAAILYTGANTSFNGFPALASFVAEDRFLPRQLMQRGYRLVFSNGIITLAALSVALLVFTGGSVNALVPFYAIGVFTGFSMAGYGMSKHHLTEREPGWRRRLAINFSGGGSVDDRGGDLRGGQVHRRGMAGRRRLPDTGLRADPAQPRVPGRVRDPAGVPHRPPRAGEVCAASGFRPGQLARPGGARGAALREGAARRRAGRRAFHGRRRARRAATDSVG